MNLRIHNEVGIFGRFVILPDPREAFDDPLPGLLVKTFHITGLAGLHGGLHEDFEELQIEVLVYGPCQPSVRLERRDEAADGDHAAVGEQFRHLRRPSNVFLAVLFGEGQIPV